MRQEVRFISIGGAALGCCSLLYFLGLAAGAPLWLTVLLIAMAILLSGRWLRKHLPAAPATPLSRRAQLAAAAGLLVTAALAVLLARRHGDWDAYYIWNLSARFLQDPVHWKALFQYRDITSHTDYPLQVPATVALLQRLVGGGWHEWAPLLPGLFYTLSIPALLFYLLADANRYLAFAIMLLVGCNTYFVNNGVVQCADVPLSFYLLLAFTGLEQYRQSPGRGAAVLAGFSLGLCLWTKNEGLLYALILLAFYAPDFFRNRKGVLPLLLALAPAALTLLLFKTAYAPQNDLVSGFTPSRMLAALGGKDRYKLTLAAFKSYTLEYFPVLAGAFVLYLVLCIRNRRLPDKSVLVFAAFAFAMLMVYVFSIHEITWHLRTSVSRILLQWYPAGWLVIGSRLRARA